MSEILFHRGKEQRESAGSAADAREAALSFLLFVVGWKLEETLGALCFTGVRFQPRRKGGRRFSLWGPHTSTMTSPPQLFPLHSDSLCCSDNGWHTHNSRDFRRERTTETFSFESTAVSQTSRRAAALQLILFYGVRINRPGQTCCYTQQQPKFQSGNAAIYSISPQLWPKWLFCEFLSSSAVGNVLQSETHQSQIQDRTLTVNSWDTERVTREDSGYCVGYNWKGFL